MDINRRVLFIGRTLDLLFNTCVCKLERWYDYIITQNVFYFNTKQTLRFYF